jgi:hypothetical protein
VISRLWRVPVRSSTKDHGRQESDGLRSGSVARRAVLRNAAPVEVGLPGRLTRFDVVVIGAGAVGQGLEKQLRRNGFRTAGGWTRRRRMSLLGLRSQQGTITTG